MALSARDTLALALDPSLILTAQGMTPDPWQRRFLLCEDPRIMLCCTRGAGKSRTTSAKALHRGLFRPNSLILLVSRSIRQATELYRYVKEGYRAIGRPVPLAKETETQMEFSNGSRIVCLPGREETIRSFQGVSLLIKDEAARIPDDVNASITPMLAVSKGQEIDLSTPWGRRGWFWKKWDDRRNNVTRFRVTWKECPRHTAEFIQQERDTHGDTWVAQEYECDFSTRSGLVYPQLVTRCSVDRLALFDGHHSGGIDFGFRNPFAAVWGYLADDVLHITGERYLRQTALHAHAAALPRGVTWYADPAHPTEINELRKAGLTVKTGTNTIAAGIAAVTARIETDRLRIDAGKCPNLLAEAGLYHYDPDRTEGQGSEKPVDEDNHALAALRYLVSRIDHAFIALWVRQQQGDPGPAVRTPILADRPRNRVADLMARAELWSAN